MATSVDIAPTVGHAVLATQLGVGSTPGYDAIDLRRAFVNEQEGVYGATDWQVTQTGAGAMSVDIAASTGRAVVQGDTIANQGLYTVAPHSGTITLTIAANAAGNPRLDQIILQVFDATHDGSGNNKATVSVLQGTATAGATLDTRSGAATLPNTAIRLADVIVASGAASILNASIRDRRPWARGASFRGVRTAGDITLTTSLVEIGNTQFKNRIECTGNLLLLNFTADVFYGANNAEPQLGFYIDGVSPDGAASNSEWGGTQDYTAVGDYGVTIASVVAPSAGSHLFSIFGAKFTGAGTAVRATASTPAVFTVVELLGRTGSQFNGTT